MTTATAQRADLVRALDANLARATRLAAEAGPRRWMTRPGPGAWSASDCVQHLVATAEKFVPRFDAVLANSNAPDTEADAPYRVSPGARLFIWLLEPPYRLRVKTGEQFVPENSRDADVDVAALAATHAALHACIERGAGLPLDRMMVASPFAERVRYSVYTSLRIIAAHERRHLWQAEQAVARVAATP